MIWRHRPDSNRGMKVLQTFALPLGDGAGTPRLYRSTPRPSTRAAARAGANLGPCQRDAPDPERRDHPREVGLRGPGEARVRDEDQLDPRGSAPELDAERWT